MKLWQVVQWGNREDGADGHDGQQLISAVDMPAAIAEATIHFGHYNHGANWKDGTPDVVFLLGQDDRPDGEPVRLTQIWFNNAFNLGLNPAWYRHPDLGWLTQKEMYGEEYENDRS